MVNFKANLIKIRHFMCESRIYGNQKVSKIPPPLRRGIKGVGKFSVIARAFVKKPKQSKSRELPP